MKFHDPLVYSNNALLLSGTRRYPRGRHTCTMTHVRFGESWYTGGWGGWSKYHCIKSIGLITLGHAARLCSSHENTNAFADLGRSSRSGTAPIRGRVVRSSARAVAQHQHVAMS